MRYPEASTSTALESSLSTASGSRTITVTVDPTQEVTEDTPSNHDSSEGTGTIGVIRLTGGRNSGPRVAWDEEVVDNEHMGKKKSKICCIYNKPRPFDESSSEESSSDSDSDSECGRDGHNHNHNHNHRHRHKSREHGVGGESGGNSGPNAYERQSSRSGKGES